MEPSDPGATASSDATRQISRRRSVRFDAPAGMTLEVADRRIVARILDLSLGGMRVSTNMPFTRGAVYEVVVRMGKHTATCQVRAVHTRRQDDGSWMVGLQVLASKKMQDLERLLDALTNSLIKFS